MDDFTTRARAVLESRRFELAITALIVVNAVTLGLETVPSVTAGYGNVLQWADRIILAVFTAEVGAKLLVYRSAFFRDPWRVFDFIIVGIALVPASGSLSVLRSLRILRAFRLITTVPSLRRVVGGLMGALPGMGSILVLLSLVFYVFSVMATKLYGEAFPEWFGSIPASAYSLFQVMTLESWSMGIVRPVMEVYPAAWVFFLAFILVTTFVVVNLVVGLIVSSMQDAHHVEADERTDHYRDEVLERLAAIEALVKEQSDASRRDEAR